MFLDEQSLLWHECITVEYTHNSCDVAGCLVYDICAVRRGLRVGHLPVYALLSKKCRQRDAAFREALLELQGVLIFCKDGAFRSGFWMAGLVMGMCSKSQYQALAFVQDSITSTTLAS